MEISLAFRFSLLYFLLKTVWILIQSSIRIQTVSAKTANYLNKPTVKCDISSVLSSITHRTPCRFAIDGKRTIPCVQTATADPNPTLKINLGTQGHFDEIVIVTSGNNLEQMTNVTVSVDDTLVYRFPPSRKYIKTVTRICTSTSSQMPISGWNITIARHSKPGDNSAFIYLHICEVEALKCFGVDCNKGCSDCAATCDPHQCDPDKGSCPCDSGWPALNCPDRNECSSNPCQNGGSCFNEHNSYACLCSSGFTGYQCQTDVNECSSSPCRNGATCTNGINQYSCTCKPGNTGVNCEQAFDVCSSTPCQHGGTCIVKTKEKKYVCSCVRGYNGINCQIDMYPCAPNPCQNGGTCTREPDRYLCTCTKGLGGSNCEIDRNECESSPCEHGICNNYFGGFNCTCNPGYTGVKCDQVINRCNPNPCQHGGICIDNVNGYTCHCTSEYAGENCEEINTVCSAKPCQSGSTCVPESNNYRCICAPGYGGAICDQNIDECLSRPCQQGGECEDSINNYTCKCITGWAGKNCEDDAKDCPENACSNQGICVDMFNNYTCKCFPGYEGTLCEIDINECLNNPCKNGTCENQLGGFDCLCNPGYTGNVCLEDLDECLSSPCQNGGSCHQPEINKYTCTCSPGHTGRNCEQNINECSSLPCQNGGTCADEINSYTCVCSIGFKGLTCTEACSDGYYGYNCNLVCGNCENDRPCDPASGYCQACQGEYQLPLCVRSGLAQEEMTNIAAGVSTVALLLALILIIAILVARRRRSPSEMKDATKDGADDGLRHENEEGGDHFYAERDGPSYGLEGKPSRLSHSKSASSLLYLRKTVSGFTLDDRSLFSFKRISSKILSGEDDDFEGDFPEADNISYTQDSLFARYSSSSHSMAFDDFLQYLLELLASQVKLSNIFAKFPVGMIHPATAGSDEKNNSKNRFKLLSAYDKNRVLIDWHDKEHTDYINASYIKGYGNDVYIAAQGPRPNTVPDMWVMIWQQNVEHIIMLTNLKEFNRVKCCEYWPHLHKTKTYGFVKVKNLSEYHTAHYIVRTFQINGKQGAGQQQQREVKQYHYTACTALSVPEALSMVDFWRYVNAHISLTVPVIVHCNDGVGRTGIYLALDITMKRRLRDPHITPEHVVKDLRDQRCSMVLSESQFRFLLEVLLEAYISRNSRLSVKKLKNRCPRNMDINSPNQDIDGEYEMLVDMISLAEPNVTIAMLTENQPKNRDPRILPDDYDIVHPHSGKGIYINAVAVSSFYVMKGLMLTQLPLPGTMADFWKIVQSFNVKHIVSLGAEDDASTIENYCQYWPLKLQEHMSAGPYIVTLAKITPLGNNLTSYRLNQKSKYTTRFTRHAITLMRYTDWATDLPGSVHDIIHVLNELKSIDRGDSPIVIQCLNGAGRSGMFCVLYDVLCRLTEQTEVDIFSAVRAVQKTRPQAVESETQYRYLYKVARAINTESKEDLKTT